MKKIFTGLLLLTFLTGAKAQYVELDNYFIRKALIKLAPECFDTQERLDTTCTKLQEIKDFYATDYELVDASGNVNEDLYNEIYGEGDPWSMIFSVNGLQYLTNLEGLDLAFGNTGVSAERRHLPNKITSIYAAGVAYFIDNYNGFSIEIPESVKHLSLVGYGYQNGGPVGCSLPVGSQLESISIRGTNNVSGIMNTQVKKIIDDGANIFSVPSGLFRQIPNTVEEIHFYDLNNNFSTISFDSELPSSLPSIKKISFNDVEFEENISLLSISNYNTLEEISFISTSNCPALIYPQSLKKITYDGCFISSGGTECIPPHINLEFLEGLESLHISNFPDLEFIEPAYPQTLQNLTLSNINISVLTDIPSTLKTLDISSNKLEIIESIPAQLESLNVSGNVSLKCLPTLPASLNSLYVVGSKITCIPNETNKIKATAALPLCPGPCGEIPDLLSGIVFLDLNKNGRLDGSDRKIQGAFIHADDKILTTNFNGEYRFYANPDEASKISVTYKHPHLDKILPAERIYSNSGNNDKIDTMHFAIQLRDVKDVEVIITPFVARNGFTPTARITVTNRGTLPVNNFNLSLHAPLHWTFVSSSPVAQNTTDSILWSNISLAVNTSRTFQVNLTVPATDTIGTPFALTAKVHNVTEDETPQNNTSLYSSAIRGSFDPNDKLVYPETLPPGYAEGTELIYTVRFQNTGNDTAFTVVVKDTIQANLDPLSFRFISGTHPLVWSLNEQGVITLTFENILLPDSNVNEPASNGQVTFAIQPKAGLGSGVSVENKAAIYFDFNAPIITNTAVSRVGVITSVNKRNSISLAVYPNPAKDIVHLQWSEGGKTNISVADISGKVIHQSVISGNYTEIPVQNLSKGMYLIQIQNEQGIGVLKVIIQ